MEHSVARRGDKLHAPRVEWIDFKGMVLICKISEQPETPEKTYNLYSQ